MKSARIFVTDESFSRLEKVFEREAHFQPAIEEDRIIVNILKQVMANSEEYTDDLDNLENQA